MDSENSRFKRRIPRQERGERRVAELVDAAAAVLSEVGYDAATMKAIAKRANASIGAVYQYFPNKDAVVLALRTQYGKEMEGRWSNLEQATAGLSVRQLAQRFVDGMVGFMEEHPAYIAVLDAPIVYKHDPRMREHLCEQLGDVFRTRRAALSKKQAILVANVCLQIIKSMNLLYAQAKPKERSEIVKEFKLALTAYFESRLTS